MELAAFLEAVPVLEPAVAACLEAARPAAAQALLAAYSAVRQAVVPPLAAVAAASSALLQAAVEACLAAPLQVAARVYLVAPAPPHLEVCLVQPDLSPPALVLLLQAASLVLQVRVAASLGHRHPLAEVVGFLTLHLQARPGIY